jgi:phosphonate transport system substrate-binding protein
VLSEKNLVSVKKLDVGSTNNVLKHVILGKADAGAVLDSFLVKEPSELSDQIKIIFTTEPISPHPLSAHPRIPQAVRDIVTKAILNFDKDGEGQAILQVIKMPDPKPVNCDLDYKNLENMDMEHLTKEHLTPDK